MPKDKKPADQDDQRLPEEASALARKVMARMLASPPVPHEQINGHGKRKQKKPRDSKPKP
jgi:hypothetical protein